MIESHRPVSATQVRRLVSIFVTATFVTIASHTAAWRGQLEAGERDGFLTNTPSVQPQSSGDWMRRSPQQDTGRTSADIRNADLYVIPDTQQPDLLLRFVRMILEFEPETIAEFQLHYSEGPNAIDVACDRVLAQDDDMTSASYRQARFAKMHAMQMRIPFEDVAYHQQAIQQLDSLITDLGPDLEAFAIAKNSMRAMEHAGSLDSAVSGYEQIGARFVDAVEPRLSNGGRRMLGSAKRLTITGQPLPLMGDTLSGAPFDWESYRGRVVLVYFWSTSIGPSESEIPRLMELQRQVGEASFEIVLVSLDVKTQIVQEFLTKRNVTWECLFVENAGWEHPLALEYGVDELPLSILVDESGTVISTSERLPAIDRRLTERFGDR